jgi:hypothetical protein
MAMRVSDRVDGPIPTTSRGSFNKLYFFAHLVASRSDSDMLR